MTSRPRKATGGSPSAESSKKDDEQQAEQAEQAAETPQAEQPEQAETPQPEQPATDGDGEDAGTGQQVQHSDTFHLDGEPQPAQVEQGMARAETGVSAEAFAGGDVPTAAYGDDERNGKAMGIPIDTSGKLRHREDAIATAAHGGTERNGLATEMIEGQTSKEFGGNGDSVAKLQNGGTRAEVGAGTGTPAPADERPTYPSTLLNRASPEAAPSEPDDVRHATEPRLGDPKTSTDPTMAASAMPSMPGDETIKLVNQAGEEVVPSQFFEVPPGPQARSFRVVKHRVSEIHTVRHAKSPSRRLLFTEGQLVPVQLAETLISLHG